MRPNGPLEQDRPAPYPLMSRPQPMSALGQVLQFLMDQRGWSRRQLAEQTGVNEQWASRVIHGHRDPAFSLVVDVLSRAGYTLVLVDDSPGVDGGCVRRRRFLLELGVVAGSSHLRFAVPLGGNGELRTADEVTAAARWYVDLEREYGGGIAYGPAVRVARQLLQRVRSEKVSTAYMQAIGWYTLETGWLAYDSGQRDAARIYGSHALRLGRTSRERRLQARAYNLLSLIATAVRDGRGAAELASRGIAAAHEAGAEQTVLWARLARAAVIRGPAQASSAMRALDRADEAATGRRDVYEAVANRGIVLGSLGNLAEARTQLAEAADIIEELGEPRNRCLYVARSAKIAVQQGQLDEAASLANQALDEAAGIVSARVDRHLSEWMALTKPPRITAVRKIRETRERLNDRVS